MSGIFINLGSVQRYGGRISSLSRAIAVLISNIIEGSAAAYSVRIPAGSTYNGSLQRVRRSSDNAEMDIGALILADANGNRWLDEQALTLFCGAPKYPLDAVSGAAAAYSLRLLRAGHTGPAIRVRRSSDNAELDVGFDARGDLDSNALLSFVRASNLLIGQTANFNNLAAVSSSGLDAASALAGAIVENTATSLHIMEWTLAADNTVKAGSFFAARGSGARNLYLSYRHASAAWHEAVINLGTGAVTNAGLTSIGVVARTRNGVSGWQVSFTTVAPASGFAPTIGLHLLSGTDASGPSRSYAGDGTSSIVFADFQIYSAAAVPSAFVATWHDQSGNARHATQSTAGNQPRIVNAGLVDTDSDRPAIIFSGSQWLVTPININRTNYPNLSISAVYRNSPLTGFQAIWGADNGGIDRAQLMSGWNFFMPTGSTFVSQPLLNNTNRNCLTSVMSVGTTDGSNVFVNGAAGTAFTESLGDDHTNLGIGAQNAGGSAPMLGNYSEFSVFASALSTTNRQFLERSQAAYYGITYASTIPSAFVTTWYDQSGNGRNAVQATAGSQPRIVNAGVVEKLNGRPAAFFSGGQVLIGAIPPTTFQPLTLNAVGNRTGGNNNGGWLSVADATTSFGPLLRASGTRVEWGAWNGTVYGNMLSAFTGAASATVATVTTDAARATTLFANGSAQGAGTAVAIGASLSTLQIGRSLSDVDARLTGYMAEAVYAQTALSTGTRQSLERSQGAAFGIKVA